MTYSYYKLTIHCTVNKGTSNEHEYDVTRYSMTPEYDNVYMTDTVVTSSELIETNNQCVILDCWSVLLFGKMYGISEEHTGTYVFVKTDWEDLSHNFDQSFKDVIKPFDWEETNLEYDGYDRVVLDFGGQLSLPDEDGYERSISEDTDLPEIFQVLPIDWELSDVGNG